VGAVARPAAGQRRIPGRRAPDAGAGFIAFWLRDGLVVAGMNVNLWDVNQHVQELIRSRQPVDPQALADPGTPLDALVALSAER